jgi:DNA repair exonuclease SbcCD ATPase subunit
MPTILEQLSAIDVQIRELQRQLHDLQYERLNVEMARYDCPHDFIPPHVNHAHEGGTCKLCGMNEVHWAHVKDKLHQRTNTDAVTL